MNSKNKAKGAPHLEDLEKIKEKLLQRKRELWREILGDLESEAKEEYQDLIQTIKDEGDTALAELKVGATLALVQMRADELEQIEQALDRIERGEYGRCQDCGHWIKSSRLEAMPYALRCRDCQQKWEMINK